MCVTTILGISLAIPNYMYTPALLTGSHCSDSATKYSLLHMSCLVACSLRTNVDLLQVGLLTLAQNSYTITLTLMVCVVTLGGCG